MAGSGLLAGSARAASPTLLASSAAVTVDGSLVAPFGRHLAFGADPQHQMRVSWQVPFAVRRPYLRVGLRPWDLGRKIEAEVRHFSTVGTFRTAPARAETFVFTAFGDQGVSYHALGAPPSGSWGTTTS